MHHRNHVGSGLDAISGPKNQIREFYGRGVTRTVALIGFYCIRNNDTVPFPEMLDEFYGRHSFVLEDVKKIGKVCRG